MGTRHCPDRKRLAEAWLIGDAPELETEPAATELARDEHRVIGVVLDVEDLEWLAHGSLLGAWFKSIQ